ncbi:hypothetical protein ATKI12_6528 [Kitasatospora sp. Ki12]|uniref:hypothetical protein n=1 Tax=Kitasatospora xanthocidica TaxID=83382 RepID=UPI0019A689A4|nr:hypothetical protein [Kitasatospora xanthocidica]GHF92189.1 hypothetical protein GCM10018790_81560 [Kitasatospora xanthocidica]
MLSVRRDQEASAETPRAALAVVIHEADELLVDEPPIALATFLTVLSQSAGQDGDSPRLVLLLDAAPDDLPELTERLVAAGFPPRPAGDA